MSIDMFDTRTMLEAVEQIPRPLVHLRDTFFPAAAASDTDALDVDIIKGGRKLAPFVSPLQEGKVVPRLGFTTSTIKPGYIKPKRATTAGDLLVRSPGATIYSGGETIEQRAQKLLGKDMAELMDEIDRREEWMAAKAIDAGAITMTIKGETGDKSVVVDFGMSATHKVTLSGTDLWSDAASSPLAKLVAWAQLISKDSGLTARKLYLGTDAAIAFLKNAEIKSLLDLRAVDVGEIKPNELPDGLSYLGRLKWPGLFVDVYCYDEWYEDETTGVLTPMLPAKKAWLCGNSKYNRTQYAVIQDIEAIEGGQAAVSRFPKSWTTKDPAVRWLMMQAAPLPTLSQPDAFVSASVLS